MSRTGIRPNLNNSLPSEHRFTVPNWILLSVLGLAVGGAIGLAVVAVSPAYVIGLLLGLLGVYFVFSDVRKGLVGLIAVVTLLPFAVIPVSLGVVKLTLVDACISAVLLVWLLRIFSDPSFTFRGTGIDLQIALFVGLSVTSFVLGTGYLETSADFRLFVKMLLAICLIFAVVGCVTEVKTLRLLVTALAVGGSAAGAIAIAIYYLPATTAIRLLSSLSRFGYPDSAILQYDANTKVLKAIGTSIDHNILGATLMMCGAIAIGLVVAPETGRRRPWLLAGLAITFAALLLTYSRGSLFGFLVGGAVIATLRFRRLWLIAGMMLIAVALVPQLAQSSFLTHVETGLMVQDKATAMRFGEYKDAFRLIAAYPIFGVGFGSAPDVDLYVGVSSIYLLLAENVGLLGAGVWLWAIGTIVVRTLRQCAEFLPPAPSVRGDPGTVPIGHSARYSEASTLAVACLGALVSALVAGLFDHHFVDIHFPHVIAMVWLIIGLIIAGLRLDRAQASSLDPANLRSGVAPVSRQRPALDLLPTPAQISATRNTIAGTG